MARNCGAVAAFFSSACVQSAFADTKIRTRYSQLGQITESTIYTHDDRQRIESVPGMIVIRQGDQKRMIQLDSQTNTYTAFSLSGPPTANETSGAAPAKKGGT